MAAGSATNGRPAATGWRRVQVALLNLTFYPLMMLWIVSGILIAPLLLVLWKVVTGWDFGRVMRHLISLHGYGLIVIVSPFVRFRPEGLERIATPCIMVVNHLSFFDSYFMASLPFHDIIFAVGAWPFKMYWYTAFMRLARYLDVEQGDWKGVLTTCSESFANRGTVLFFPEGHRSRTGELQPFFSGAFKLAKETGVPVVPLCITGTDVMLPPGRFSLHPTTVRLKVLEPLHPQDFPGKLGHLAMRETTRERMAAMLAQMQGEPC